jgi:hypothetical protein
VRADPERTCVGCRRRAPASGLVRVAAGPQGGLGSGRGAPGRGAWFCSAECFDDAVRRRALARALRREITSTEAQALRATLFD